MKKITFLLVLMTISLLSYSNPWGHRYATEQTNQNIVVDVSASFTVSVEWGEGEWDANGSSFGYGLTTDGSDWTWVDLPWFENGDGSNKRCKTDVTINQAGKYYYAYRMIKNSNTSYSFGSDSWSENSSTLSATSTIIVGKVSAANGAWNNSSSWEGGSVPISTDDVAVMNNITLSSSQSINSVLIYNNNSLTISESGQLTVNNDLINNAGNNGLVIQSDATGTGSLIVNGSVTGDATVQRYMTNYTVDTNGWHLLSAPVSNFTISGSDFAPVANVDDLYKWDESTNTWLNYNGGDFGDTQFQTGKGYLVAYSSAATKEFTGNINTGTFTKNLSYTSTSPHKGWNLLGNPYTSAIDWDLLTKSSNVDGSVYVLRASDGAYISWNGSAGDLINGIIPAMQGYFVKTTATGESVTMEAADQVHSTANFYKSGKELAENTFYITVNGNNGESNAYIQFRDDATKTFDHAFDAYKLFGYSTAPQIYTNDGENIYSINCLPADMQSYSLPVGVKISASGEYNISFNGIENVSDNFDIKLEDLQTGEQTKVYPETTYKFSANEDDDPNRFVLHFYNVTSTPEIGDANNKALIYSYNNNIIVKATDKQLNGKVEIINILGQTMETKSVSNSNFLTINTNLNKGVYIVRYKETDGYTQSQKVIIN